MPNPHDLNVAFTFIAVCAGSLFFMTAAVGLKRLSIGGVLRGDGGEAALYKRIRIHGNFIENAPLMALVLLAAEMLGIADAWLWLAVASFVAGRIYHYVRYDAADRGFGMALTTGPALALGAAVLVQAWAA